MSTPKTSSASAALLVLSLAVNLGLVAAVLASWPTSTDAANDKVRGGATSRPNRMTTATLGTAPVAGSKVQMREPGAGLWMQLRTDDLEELVRRLKTAGFPPTAIGAIVSRLVEEQFHPRRRELMGRLEDVPYWKTPGQAYNDPAKAEQLNALALEQSALMKKLLGPEYWLDDEQKRRRYGNLPEEKIAALRSISSDYEELMIEATRDMQKRGGLPAATDQQRLAWLEKEQRTDIAKLLSPEEFLDYELRNSRVASRLRNDTKAFRPTEAEFRAMFPFYQSASETLLNEMAASAVNPDAAARTADAQAQAKLKELLGPERYADYLQSKDPAFDKLNRIVLRLELPLSAARTVVAVQKEVTERAAAVKADRSLTAEQRQAQLSALAQEATSRITGTLGSRGFNAYQQSRGQWLEALQPNAATGKQ